MKGRGRGTRRALLGCMLILLVAGFVPPAMAHAPAGQLSFVPSHFNGQDRCHGPDVNCTGDPGDSNEGQMATDHFDGIDSFYRFRAAATPETQYFDWYNCIVGGNPFDPGECQFIGRDTTRMLSTPPPGIQPVAVFELTWDIPPIAATGGFARHLFTLACIDGPPPIPPTRSHCEDDQIRIHFDDASETTDHAPTTSGQFLNLTHGGAVPNAGFTAIAYTSQDDIGRILFCLDRGVNPTPSGYFNASPAAGCDPGSARDTTANDSTQCSSVPPGTSCWEVLIDPPDNSEFSLGIVEQDDPTSPVESGTSDCEGDTEVGGDGANSGDDCQLDKIYMTSSATAPPPPTPVPLPGGQTPAALATCQAGDSALNPVAGTVGNDTLVGTKERDVICGFEGRDVLRGLGQSDLLLGAAGDDRLVGGGGNDRLRGQAGRDVLIGGGGRDRLAGGPGSDRCVGASDRRTGC